MFQLIPPEQKRKLKSITILLIYAPFASWFLVNGPGLFPNWNETWTFTIIIYLVMLAIFLIVDIIFFLSIKKKIPPDLAGSQKGKTLLDNIIGFCWAFIATILICIGLRDSGYYFQNLSQMPLYLIPATLVYQLVIVACCEEIIFRGVIFQILYHFNRYVAWFGSAVIFSIFHYTAYGVNLSSFIIALLLGIILAMCADRWNLGVTIGIHWAYNIFVMGAIVSFI